MYYKKNFRNSLVKNKRFIRLIKFIPIFLIAVFCLIEIADLPVFASTLFSDDFTGTTINTSTKWIIADTSGTNVTQNNSLTVSGNNNWNSNGVRTVSSYNRTINNLIIDGDLTFSDCSASSGGIMYGPWQPTLGTGSILFNVTSGVFKIWSYNTSATVTGTCTNGASNHVKIVIKSAGGVDVYLNNSPTPNGSLSAAQAPNTYTNFPVSLQQYSSGSTTNYDNIVISDFLITVAGVPTGLSATSGEFNQSSLSWAAPSSNGGSAITDYRVEYKLTSDSSWTTFNDGVSTSTTATVTGLTNAVSYDFRVSAINAVGTGPASSTFSVVVYSAPSSPTNLYGVPTSGQVTLTWTTPIGSGNSPIIDYIIESRIGSGSWSTFADGISTSTTAIVTGLTNNTTYEFRVSSSNSTLTGSPSVSTFVTVGTLGLADTFTGTIINGTKWTEFDSAVGGAGGTVGNVQQNGSVTATGNDTWGVNGLQSVATFDRSNGDVAVQVTMSSDSCTVGSTFEFGYGDLNFITSGTAYFVTKNASTWYLYSYLNGASQGSVVITGVSCTAGVPITMKLVAFQAGGASVYVNGATTPNATKAGGTFNNKHVFIQNYSSVYTTTFDNLYVLMPPSMPDAPTGLSSTVGDGQISLNWTASNDNGSSITDYIVEYKSGSGSYATFADGVSSATSAVVTGLTNGLTYTFRVSAVNTNGTSPTSGTINSVPVTATPSAPSVASVSIVGTPAVDEILTGSYTYIDPNANSEGTSLFRWLSSTTAGGTYTPISGATGLTYLVTSGDLNKYLKFEVTPVSTVAPTTGSAALSSASAQVATGITYVNHILSTGQSLSVGQQGTPALSTTQPYSNLMLSGSSLVPLVESGVETMSSAMANSITAKVTGNAYQSAVTRHGVGGTAYVGLKKGTTPYNNGIAQVSSVKAATLAAGKSYRAIGVTTIHGESDHVAGNASSYEGYLAEWQHDYETDIKAIDGQLETIPMFTDQMSSHTGYSSTTSGIPIAQLAASEDYPGKIILVTPKYFFTYADSAHLVATSYRWLGEYYGKVMKKVLVDHQTWIPLSPKQVVRNSNIIYARFNVPAGPIVFDTTAVSAKANYGFEYADDTSSASISSVQIIDAETVKVTLNTAPTGTNPKLRYAYTGTSGAQPGAQVAGSAHGNLRDSDATTSLYGNNLYNWSVHFDKAITADTTAPISSSITATPVGTTGETISWITNEEGSSIVDYGLTASYGTSTTETDTPNRVLSHSVALSGLSACTTYHYRVHSKDLAQNDSPSSDAIFTTACPDSTPPTASITYSDADATVKAGDSLTITATFSEPIADAPIMKIAISGSNTVSATNMTKVDSTHYTYVHTVGAGDGTATVALSIGTDIAGNVVTSAPTSGATFTVDNTVTSTTHNSGGGLLIYLQNQNNNNQNNTIPVNTNTTPINPSSIYGSKTSVVRINSRGTSAENVQRAINQLKAVTPPLVIDGKIGKKSVLGIMAVQRILGTKADGIWGKNTQKAYESFLSRF